MDLAKLGTSIIESDWPAQAAWIVSRSLLIMQNLQKYALQDMQQRTLLPQELIDSVVDHLHNDTASLVACSLVSDNWLWSARYHLFHDISIATLHEKHGLVAFIQSVSSSPLQLGNHVKVLRVRGAHDQTRDALASILKFFEAVLPWVPFIRKIYLSQMVWGQTDALALGISQPMPWELGLLSLKDIRLEALDSESLDNAWRLLSLFFQQFSCIRLLIINTVRVGYRALYDTSNNLTAPPPEYLHTINHGSAHRCRILAVNCFTEDDSFYLLPTLARLGLSQHIQTLKFGSGCREITASAQAVANLAAASLRFVRYRVPSDEYVVSKIPVFDLSRCKELHTAHLRGYVSTAAEARTVLSQMINTVMYTPTETQAVILEFFARPQDFHFLYDNAGNERWSLLDQQLAARDELRRVVIVLRSSGIPMVEKPGCMLPLLHNKDRLRCIVGKVSDRIQWHRLTGF